MALVSIIESSQKMTKTELAYIAGFIDGEGCLTIGLNKNRSNVSFSARLIIVNTDKKIIEWLFKKIGGSYRRKIQPGKLHKLAYHLTLSDNKKLFIFLKIIHPFLRMKKRQAMIIINILNQRFKSWRMRERTEIKKKEIIAVQKIRRLNKKGC